MIYFRIVCFLALIFSIVFCPLLVVLALFALLVSFFSKFWEGILAGIFLDSIYFSPAVFLGFGFGFFTISFIISVFFFEKSKRLIQGRNFISTLAIAFLGWSALWLAVNIFFKWR